MGRALHAIRSDHVQRYAFAAARIRKGERVYDAACGVGYGSYLLHCVGGSVTGIDRSAEAIAIARVSYPGPTFFEGDATEVPGEPDIVVGLEMLEHLDEPERFLANVAAAKPRLTILTTPQYEGSEPNPFHLHHWTRDEFGTLLDKYFPAIEWWGQDREGITPGVGPGTIYMIAVCGAICS